MDLLKRLEAAESRSEEMSESVSQATKPLLRQLEQVQSSLSHKTSLYMRQEEMMTEKIADLQAKLESISETNRSLGEENANLKSRCSVLETKINAKNTDRKKLDETIESLKEQNKKLTEENEVLVFIFTTSIAFFKHIRNRICYYNDIILVNRHKQAMKMLEEAHATEIKEFKREISSLESKISMEKAAAEAEKRKNNAALEQQSSIDEELRYSPTLSIERDSVSSANSIWPAVSFPSSQIILTMLSKEN